MNAAESRYLIITIAISVSVSVRKNVKKRRAKHSRLGSNLQRDAVRRLRAVVDGASGSFDVAAHAVVIARRELRELVRREERNGVLRRAVPDTSGVTGNPACTHVVLRLTAEQEAVPAEDSVRSERWTLRNKKGVSIT